MNQLPLTEQQNPKSHNLDQLSSLEIVQIMHSEDYTMLKSMEAAQPEIAKTIDRVVKSFKQGGRLFYIGAGTSGRLGVLDAAECPPTYSAPPEMVQGIIAGGDAALGTAIEGAEDSTEQAERDLRAREIRPEDMVIGIAASGTTPYVRSGLRFAKDLGCQTALIACNPIPQDDTAIDEWIVMPVGPEVVSGSTRLKAGTSTKLALNMISTISMIKMGKVYDNLMVDMTISNQKLQKRAERMLHQLTGISHDAARSLLKSAQGEVKTALLMQIKGLNYAEACAELEKTEGHLRPAIGQNA